MDPATLIGLLGGIGIIIGAILIGGSAVLFFNIPGLLIVIGGTMAAVLIKFPIGHFFNSFRVAVKAFIYQVDSGDKLIQEAINLSGIARKGGLLALEQAKVSNDFLQKGIQLCADGHDAELVRKMMTRELNSSIERHEIGQRIFKAIGDSAPAMGMIGTLIGLVQMLANMDDPKAIGPAMAVALLTTLYGALIANLFALPIAGKLGVRSEQEKLTKSLIIESIAGIQEGMNPRVLENVLQTFLPNSRKKSSGAKETTGKKTTPPGKPTTPPGKPAAAAKKS